MTERWRKKLGSLDGVGPGDDLLDRAKAGSRTEAPIELPSGRSRVVTGVTAFVVFALAISVFVVPALRSDGRANTEPAGTSNTSPPVVWTTYTDPLGWTIDVPKDWQTLSYDGSSGVPADAKGASFFSGQPSVTPGGPFSAIPGPGDVMLRVFHRDPMDPIGEDSTFPLSTDPFEQQLGSGSPTLGWIRFQGDGVTFQVDITFGDGADPNTYWPDLKRMVRSIRFEPFQQGDIVNGYVALMPSEQMADNVPKMVQTQDGTQWAMSTTDTTGSQIRVIALPATVCEDHGNPGPTDWTMQMGSLHVRCGDGLEASYTGAGDPAAGNPETWNDPLPGGSAVISWDGWVLAPLTAPG